MSAEQACAQHSMAGMKPATTKLQATETLLTCFTYTTSYNQASGKHICISLARLILFLHGEW
jgi:hypothetical protein